MSNPRPKLMSADPAAPQLRLAGTPETAPANLPETSTEKAGLTLGRAIEAAVERLGPAVEPQRIRLSARIDAAVRDEPARRIWPVILHGVYNAVEAIETDGQIASEARREAPRTEQRAGALVIEIRDDGPGASELLPRLAAGLIAAGFSTKATGLGWGLMASEAIVRQAGGTLRLDNAAEGGAVLTIRLPLSAGPRLRYRGGGDDD